jgi:hypothetical protein
MVKRLHGVGIEVILDVVYNHTAEGGELGPTLSLRGIDNASYYRLDPADRRRYVDFTGCGNSLNMVHPRTVQLIMDSLRYWVLEMHVDGFRFDLAPALAREAIRGQPARHLLRQPPAVSGPVTGDAHRGALGSRSRRLPGRQFSRRVDGVERQVPGHRATLLAWRYGSDGGPGVPAHREQRPLRLDRAKPLRQHQLRHLPRRLRSATS